MDEIQIRAWFDRYLSTFAARGRGDDEDLQALLEFYGVPLLLSTDEATATLSSAHEVMEFARQEVEGMRAAGYHKSKTIRSEVTMPNASSALYSAEFVRQQADGSEIGRLAVTYLITTASVDSRISAMLVHTP
jgi:hypothetical protein